MRSRGSGCAHPRNCATLSFGPHSGLSLHEGEFEPRDGPKSTWTIVSTSRLPTTSIVVRRKIIAKRAAPSLKSASLYSEVDEQGPRSPTTAQGRTDPFGACFRNTRSLAHPARSWGRCLKGEGSRLIGWMCRRVSSSSCDSGTEEKLWTSTMRQWSCRISASSRRDCVLMGAAADRLDLVDRILSTSPPGRLNRLQGSASLPFELVQLASYRPVWNIGSTR